MILNLKAKKPQSGASASVVDGKLILSLPEAISPIVWQMDLAHAKASALEVLQNEDAGHYTLKLKTPKGETVEVASFDERAQAVAGLMAASGALENAHGQIRPASADNVVHTASNTNTNPAQVKKNSRRKLLTGILALIVLFILFTIWSAVIPQQVSTDGSFAPTAATSGNANPQTSSGVPVSADAFLRSP